MHYELSHIMDNISASFSSPSCPIPFDSQDKIILSRTGFYTLVQTKFGSRFVASTPHYSPPPPPTHPPQKKRKRKKGHVSFVGLFLRETIKYWYNWYNQNMCVMHLIPSSSFSIKTKIHKKYGEKSI